MKSNFTGVYWDAGRKKWAAKISVGRKRITIGRYKTERLAAIAWNKYVIDNCIVRQLNKIPPSYEDML